MGCACSYGAMASLWSSSHPNLANRRTQHELTLLPPPPSFLVLHPSFHQLVFKGCVKPLTFAAISLNMFMVGIHVLHEEVVLSCFPSCFLGFQDFLTQIEGRDNVDSEVNWGF